MESNDEDVRKAVAKFVVGEDLSALSIDELELRITAYEGEIARLRQMIDEKERSKSDANAFFRE